MNICREQRVHGIAKKKNIVLNRLGQTVVDRLCLLNLTKNDIAYYQHFMILKTLILFGILLGY